MEEDRIYEVVGGSRDGSTIRLKGGGELPIGHEYRCVARESETLTEVYLVREDGKYHFEGYGLKPYVTAYDPKDPSVHKQQIQEEGAIFNDLDAPLDRLREHYRKYGYKTIGTKGFRIVPVPEWISDEELRRQKRKAD